VTGDAPTSRADVLAGLEAERAERGRRPPAVRAVTILGGSLLGLLSLPLVVVLPEIGVPMLLVALRLLAYEFAWAARAYASVAWTWTRVKTWFAGRPAIVQTLVLLALAAVAIALIALLL
jgi:hypothetical protein